jgi:hypothetical protein
MRLISHLAITTASPTRIKIVRSMAHCDHAYFYRLVDWKANVAFHFQFVRSSNIRVLWRAHCHNAQVPKPHKGRNSNLLPPLNLRGATATNLHLPLPTRRSASSAQLPALKILPRTSVSFYTSPPRRRLGSVLLRSDLLRLEDKGKHPR